jgi:hypothetical protein
MLRIEPRALHKLRKWSTTELHPQPTGFALNATFICAIHKQMCGTQWSFW